MAITPYQSNLADPFGGSQPGADAINGANGAATPGSQINAANQKKVTGNPFSDALAGAATWSPLTLGPPVGATVSTESNPFAAAYSSNSPGSFSADAGTPTIPATPPQGDTGGNDSGAYNSFSGSSNSAPTAPRQGPTTPPGAVGPVQGPPPGGWIGPPSFVTPPNNPATPPSGPTDPNAPIYSVPYGANFTGETDRTRPSETPTDPFYKELYRYASEPGYEYLKDQPDLLRGYYQYHDDLKKALIAVGFDGSAADRVDIVDWLKRQGQNSPKAGRNGYDTYIDIPAAPTIGVTPSGGSGGYTMTTVGQPQQVDPAYAALATQYALSDPGYSWIGAIPSAVQEYQEWANNTGNTDTDIVDWLAHQPAYQNRPNPQAKRAGYDTFLYTKDANGQVVPRTGTATPDPNATPGSTITPSGGSGGYSITGPATTPAATTTTPQATTTPGPTATTTPQTATTPAATTTTPQATTTPGEIASLIDLYRKEYQSQQPDIESMLNPMFARQRMNLIGDMNADAAATGAIRSGGFGQEKGEAVADLSGKQSATLADYTSKQSLAQMEQNTALAQLSTGAGMQKFLAEMNDKLQRDNVQTNADLQKWLNSADNTLKAKGIDAQAVWEKYQADIGLEGKKIDAQAQIDAAKFHEAAASVAASTQARVSMENAKLQHQLGLDQLSVARENNIGNFILGALGLVAGGAGNLGDILKQLPPGLIVTTP